MATETESTAGDGSSSSLRTIVLLGVSFAVGYLLGARGGDGTEWDHDEREPTEISIDESGTTSDERDGDTEGEETEASDN